MIPYTLLLARKHGAVDGYPVMISFGDAAAVSRKYEELSGPGCAEFGKEHSELLFVSDGVTLANHDFPDPSVVEAQRKARVLAEARQIQADADKARADVAAAKERAATALAAVKQLTPEQAALLAEDEKARAAIETQQKAASDAEAKAQAEAKAERDRRDAEAKAKADAIAARGTFIADLAGQSDEELAKMAVDNKLQLAGADRGTIIEALAVAAGFPPAEA